MLNAQADLEAGTHRLSKEWGLVDPIFSERDRGDPSLRTSSSTGIINVTLAALMDDNHVSDNDGNNEDDPEVADGVSLGPRLSNSQVSNLPSLPPSLRAESLPPSAQASQMPSIRGSERSEPSGTGVDAPGEVKADRIPLEQRRAGTGGSSSLGGMEALEGVYEGVETSEQEFKLEHRDHMKRKLDLQQRAMQDARREGRDRRRKEKKELLLAWRKEIREEARERMKHDRSLTYDEAVREARQGMRSGSESDSDA